MNESVQADDLTGRNNCPLFMRITAIHMMGDKGRAFLSTEAVFCDHGREGMHDSLEKLDNCIPTDGDFYWAEREGMRHEFRSLRRLSIFLPLSPKQIRHYKRKAIAAEETSVTRKGTTFGWM
jgi:hypothetical protein